MRYRSSYSKCSKTTKQPSPGSFRYHLILLPILIAALTFISGCAEKAPKEKNLEFKLVKKYYSEDQGDPYFFAGILSVCGNFEYIYISDWKTAAVKIFDHDLNFIKSFGSTGSGPGEFGQLMVDMACSDRHLFVITLNRLYVFSAQGEFIKETVLKFFPTQLFCDANGLIFKTGGSNGKIFIHTDFNGTVKKKFYQPKTIQAGKCGKIIATPRAYLSSTGTFYVLNSTGYKIEVLNPGSPNILNIFTRGVDFQSVKCRGSDENSYVVEGGFSKMLETSNGLMYIYYGSKNRMHIDWLTPKGHNLVLQKSAIITGQFSPSFVLKHKDGERFICTIKDQADTLYLCRLDARN